MSSFDPWSEFLRSFGYQAPVLLVCIGGIAIIIGRWKQAGPGAMWALLGFGIPVFLAFVIPLAQVAVRSWLTNSGNSSSTDMANAYMYLGLIWSVVRAVGYGCLLAAILAGRATPESGVPPLPPLRQP